MSEPPVYEYWRKVLLETIEEGFRVLVLDEACQCHCFYGHPGIQKKLKKPCDRGHCPNNSGLARAILGMLRGYARGKISKEDLERWKEGKLTYSRVSGYMKTLQTFADYADIDPGKSDLVYSDFAADEKQFKLQLRNEERDQQYYWSWKCKGRGWWRCENCLKATGVRMAVYHPPELESCVL